MATHTNILYVIDDLPVANHWTAVFAQSNWSTTIVNSTQKALDWRQEHTCDLIMVEESQSLNGCDTVKQLRLEAIVPILLLLPTADEEKMLAGYQAGADDCIAKPIPQLLLLSKLKVWFRYSNTVPVQFLEALQVGFLYLDPLRHEVVIKNGLKIALSKLEFRALHVLASHAGQKMETTALLERIWDGHLPADQVLVKKLIYRLRRKIEPDPRSPRHILSVAGGYVFSP